MKKIALSFALIFMCCVSFGQVSNRAARQFSGAKIEFKNIMHDFGDIKKGSPAKCEFEFANTGNAPLLLTHVSSSCDCAVPSWPKAPVLPGQKGIITVEYDTGELGVISKTIYVNSNANPLIELRIVGYVIE